MFSSLRSRCPICCWLCSARSYLKSLPRKRPCDIGSKYIGADPAAIDLLQHLLQFDPRKRLTAREALSHPYLKEIRQDEFVAVVAAVTCLVPAPLVSLLPPYLHHCCCHGHCCSPVLLAASAAV